MIPATLTHHTSTYLRFRTSQISKGLIPSGDQDIKLQLPTGDVVDAHFNSIRGNPNVTGQGLYDYNVARLAWRETERVLVDVHTGAPWVVYLIDDAKEVAHEVGISPKRVEKGELAPGGLNSLLKLADSEARAGKRKAAYDRILRPPSLRRLFLGLVGAECQVEDCGAYAAFSGHWGSHFSKAIVEIHHIEEVAKVVDHHPRNLCVLCANHHKLIHAINAWSISHDGPDVVLQSGGKRLKIVRPAAMFEVQDA